MAIESRTKRRLADDRQSASPTIQLQMRQRHVMESDLSCVTSKWRWISVQYCAFPAPVGPPPQSDPV
ncbi:hypothetical protein KCP77_19855 [Salmonella enterica subsp. enterica]|nr:hypothetical protein KCP77_19855 [Salmonella enterica subsp. enterica]